MNRKIILETIAVTMAAAIINIAAVRYQATAGPLHHISPAGRELPAEVLYSELEGYREKLEGTVAELRDELAGKRNELEALDRELSELEAQYNMLLAERKRIADRLEYLKGVQ